MFKIFENRFSCREFLDKDIDKDDFRKVLELARLSPSSLGLEPWYFIATQDKNKIKELGIIANNQTRVSTCAALIIIVSRYDFAAYFEDKLRKRDMSKEEIEKRIQAYKPFLESMNFEERKSYSKQQAHIALATILYAATSLNLGSCAIGGFSQKDLDKYLGLDTGKEQATVMVALGHRKDKEIPAKSRFNFNDVVKFI
ncbi:nitroreductase family protein [uncultured Campylobacter sp.]|uniref:nitroreductase family protein n=1 Tax=uncultured Campylobacter sp. TaxID=218934 RepID=UPI0026174F4B|nr:nitroreductase family protein [uncultured Campylobacter sp.]